MNEDAKIVESVPPRRLLCVLKGHNSGYFFVDGLVSFRGYKGTNWSLLIETQASRLPHQTHGEDQASFWKAFVKIPLISRAVYLGWENEQVARKVTVVLPGGARTRTCYNNFQQTEIYNNLEV